MFRLILILAAMSAASPAFAQRVYNLPDTPDNLFEVQGCQQAPDLKNRPSKTKYTATLTKFGGKLPPSS